MRKWEIRVSGRKQGHMYRSTLSLLLFLVFGTKYGKVEIITTVFDDYFDEFSKGDTDEQKEEKKKL